MHVIMQVFSASAITKALKHWPEKAQLSSKKTKVEHSDLEEATGDSLHSYALTMWPYELPT